MGAARVTATGKREMIKSAAQVKKIEAERTRTMAKVLDSVDDTGGLIRDERGNYSGLRFSKKQIDALLASDAITGTLRKALEKIREMPDDSGDVLRGATAGALCVQNAGGFSIGSMDYHGLQGVRVCHVIDNNRSNTG